MLRVVPFDDPTRDTQTSRIVPRRLIVGEELSVAYVPAVRADEGI